MLPCWKGGCAAGASQCEVLISLRNLLHLLQPLRPIFLTFREAVLQVLQDVRPCRGKVLKCFVQLPSFTPADVMQDNMRFPLGHGFEPYNYHCSLLTCFR